MLSDGWEQFCEHSSCRAAGWKSRLHAPVTVPGRQLGNSHAADWQMCLDGAWPPGPSAASIWPEGSKPGLTGGQQAWLAGWPLGYLSFMSPELVVYLSSGRKSRSRWAESGLLTLSWSVQLYAALLVVIELFCHWSWQIPGSCIFRPAWYGSGTHHAGGAEPGELNEHDRPEAIFKELGAGTIKDSRSWPSHP